MKVVIRLDLGIPDWKRNPDDTVLVQTFEDPEGAAILLEAARALHFNVWNQLRNLLDGGGFHCCQRTDPNEDQGIWLTGQSGIHVTVPDAQYQAISNGRVVTAELGNPEIRGDYVLFPITFPT